MFLYLATPYSKFPDGLDAAFNAACVESARYVNAGIRIYCPMVHTHPIAKAAQINPIDLNIWLAFDEPFIRLATGLIFAQLPGWEKSIGMEAERKDFIEAGKPVFTTHPHVALSESDVLAMKRLCAP